MRQLLFGPSNPHFTGCVAYRGLIPAERVKNLNVEVNAQRWMGPGKHIVIYYVSAKRLLNFVGIVEQNTWTDESWTDRGDVKDLRAAFADWDANLLAIIETIDETFIWGLFDRTPLPRWVMSALPPKADMERRLYFNALNQRRIVARRLRAVHPPQHRIHLQ